MSKKALGGIIRQLEVCGGGAVEFRQARVVGAGTRQDDRMRVCPIQRRGFAQHQQAQHVVVVHKLLDCLDRRRHEQGKRGDQFRQLLCSAKTSSSGLNSLSPGRESARCVALPHNPARSRPFFNLTDMSARTCSMTLRLSGCADASSFCLTLPVACVRIFRNKCSGMSHLPATVSESLSSPLALMTSCQRPVSEKRAPGLPASIFATSDSPCSTRTSVTAATSAVRLAIWARCIWLLVFASSMSSPSVSRSDFARTGPATSTASSHARRR